MTGSGVCLKRGGSVAALSAVLTLSLALRETTTPRRFADHQGAAEISRRAAPFHQPTRDPIGFSYDRLPLSFELNRGQADSNVKFLSRGNGYSLSLMPAEAVLALKGDGQRVDILRTKLVGANRRARLVGLDDRKAVSHYFLGNDPKSWRANVPIYSKVRCEDVYPGVDLVYYGNQHELEYDFVIAPGVDPKVITIGLEGAETIRVEDSGDLVLSVPQGDVRHHRPVVYQEVEGVKRRVSGAYLLRGGNLVGFEVGVYDARLPLVIDPVLSYSTYLGGSSADEIRGVAVDSSGSVYVTGNTISTNFYQVNSAQSVFSGPNFVEDAFVAKLNREGTALIYSTYLGGHGSDLGLAIAVDSLGSAYVTGQTSSADFPTTAGAFQASPAGALNVFVAKLNPSGRELLYSTYLGGGMGTQRGNSVAVDSTGNAYVTGKTTSADFPTTPSSFQRNLRGFEDAYVSKLNAVGGGLVYSTLLGGDSSTDEAFGVAVDSGGFVYVVGHTTSTNFPTTAGAVQRQFGGGNQFGGDAFVSKLNQAGSALAYSTYLGGLDADVGRAIAVGPEGQVCVTGTTKSNNFPAVNAIQPANASGCIDNFSNCTDAFAAKLSQSGDHLVYSTYLGGASRGPSPFQAGDSGAGIAVDQTGNAYVVGLTSSTDFPAMRPLQSGNAGNGDAFVVKLNVSGGLIYSTYFGGQGDEGATAVAASANGDAYVVGVATSHGFPTTNGSLQPGFNGSFESFAFARDGFVVRIISDAPRIAAAAISGKNLVVLGEGFDEGAVIILNGDPQKTKHNAPDPTIELKGKKTGKRIDPGQTVTLLVRNGNGALSNEFRFTRPVE